MAAAAGLVALIMMLFFGTVSFIGALFLSGVIFVALGLLFGFLFCRDLPAPPGRAGAPASRTAASEAPEAPPGPEAAPEPATPEPATPEPATAPRAPQAPAAPSVRSGTQLPGQEDLARRKGEWRYQGAAPAPASAPAAQPAPAATEGRKPEGLSAPRDGAPDNLKEIRGIGPRLQKLLNSMGYFHFDQLAAWSPDEVAWVDENLPGFKGRVSRDDWVGQARTLAGGGQTEFASRVRDGDVYE